MQETLTIAAACRVMVIDDSPVVLEFLRLRLLDHGYDVQVAASGAEALELVAASPVPYDIFIIDVMMPGMDGYDVTRSLREGPTTRLTPVLMLTSLDTPQATVIGLEAGADDFLSKGVSDGELIARVRSLITLGQLRQRVANDGEVRERLFTGKHQVVSGDSDEASGRIRVLLLDVNPVLSTELEHVVDYRDDILLVSGQPIDARTDVVISSFEALSSAASATEHGVVVIDSTPSAQRRIEAFERGVEDYVPSDAPIPEIAARISSIIRRRRRFHSMEVAREQAVLAAITDPLTGLYNRAYLEEHLRGELARTERYADPFTLIMVDLDWFKRINDTWGHPVGDAVLREAAVRLRGAGRATDFVARYGGEEFTMVLPHLRPGPGLEIAEQVRAAFDDRPFSGLAEEPLWVSVSVGVAFAPRDGLETETLIARADEALYVAKRTGRNRVVSTLSDSDDSFARLSTAPRMDSLLRDASHVLAGLVSEDLKSPLNNVRVAAELMAFETTEDHDLRPFIESIRRSNADVKRLLEELLARVRVAVEVAANSEPHEQ